jgi:nucleotide-binding universal stress UspA family protein
MFTKVIWATDGSKHADRAMTHAVGVAKRDGAELVVVHIGEKLVGARASGLDTFANEGEIRAKIEGQAAALAAEGDLATSVHIVAGVTNRIGDRIAEIAEQVGGDLIVVGTRGHGTVGALMLGSVTQRLLHVSHVPILAVPPRVAREATRPAEAVGLPA